MNKTSIVLRDGSGYVGYLESIHMLHCVVWMLSPRVPMHYPSTAHTYTIYRNGFTNLSIQSITLSFKALTRLPPLTGVRHFTLHSSHICSRSKTNNILILPMPDHCLEVLRQGIMCNADIAINTYTWGTPYEIKGNRDWPRKCTNWDRVAAWADERRVTFEGAEKFLASLVQSDEPGSLGPMY